MKINSGIVSCKYLVRNINIIYLVQTFILYIVFVVHQIYNRSQDIKMNKT